LQRRGFFRKEYTGATLRENLELPRAELGWWRGRAQPAAIATAG
jgi:hypothetical protein